MRIFRHFAFFAALALFSSQSACSRADAQVGRSRNASGHSTTAGFVLTLSGTAPAAAADKVQKGVADIAGALTAAEVTNYEGVGEKTEWVETACSIKIIHIARSIADDETLTLPIPTNFGLLEVRETGGQWGYVTVGSDGAVSTYGAAGSANFVTTDTDAKFCVFDDGAAAVLKNRTGSAAFIIGLYRWN